MGKIFSGDSPFFAFMGLLFDLIILNLLWLICCVPLFTIGASTSALYTVLLKRAKDEEGYIVRGFFGAFKSNFRQSLPLTLVFLAVSAILVLDLMITRSWQGAAGSLMYGFCFAAGVAFAAVYSYVWPLVAKFENTARGTLGNAWRLALVKLPKTVLLTCMNMLPALLFVFATGIFVRLIPLLFLIAGSGIAYLAAKLLNPVFDELIER